MEAKFIGLEREVNKNADFDNSLTILVCQLVYS